MSVSRQMPVKSEAKVVVSLSTIFGLRMFGLFMLLPVFSVLGSELAGATPALVGTAIGIYGLCQALFQLPFGILSDRVGRKPLILLGLVLFVAGGVIAAVSESIYGVIAGRAIQGAGAIASVIMALLADLISEQHRTRAMAVVGMSIGGSFALAMILGPFIAHWLGGLSALFWFTAGLGAIALLVALVAVPSTKTQVHEGLGFRERFLKVIGHPVLVRLNVGIFTLHLVMTAMFVVLPLLLTRQVGVTIGTHGWLYLLSMVLGVVCMVPLMILSERAGRVMQVKRLGIALLLVTQLMLLRDALSVWWIVLCLSVFFTGFNLLEALLPSLVGRAAPAGTKGTSMGVYSSSQFLGVFVGAQLGGVLMQWQSATVVFVAMAIVLAGWFLFAASLKELPKLDNRVIALPAAGLRHQACWTKTLLAVPGVIEAVVLLEEKVAMIKVDPRYLDEALLERVVSAQVATSQG